MIKASHDFIELDKQYSAEMKKAFGSHLINWYHSLQIKDMDAITIAQNLMLALTENISQSTKSNEFVLNDLSILSEMHEIFIRKRDGVRLMQNKLLELHNRTKKVETFLLSLETSGKSFSEIQKAKEQFELAQSDEKAAELKYNALANEFSQHTKEYEQQFIRLLCATIGESSNSKIRIMDMISEFGSTLKSIESTSITITPSDQSLEQLIARLDKKIKKNDQLVSQELQLKDDSDFILLEQTLNPPIPVTKPPKPIVSQIPEKNAPLSPKVQEPTPIPELPKVEIPTEFTIDDPSLNQPLPKQVVTKKSMPIASEEKKQPEKTKTTHEQAKEDDCSSFLIDASISFDDSVPAKNEEPVKSIENEEIVFMPKQSENDGHEENDEIKPSEDLKEEIVTKEELPNSDPVEDVQQKHDVEEEIGHLTDAQIIVNKDSIDPIQSPPSEANHEDTSKTEPVKTVATQQPKKKKGRKNRRNGW